MSSTRDTANTFFDQLAEIIELCVKSGNYKLDPKWFENVHWTPCGWDLDPCKPYPFQMRTKSFCMELFHPGKKQKFAQWLTVKESTICADAGYGLYAARFFKKDDTITIYVGKKANNQNTDDSRRLDISGNLIDVQPSYFGARPLYFGAHFANSPYYHIPNHQHDAYNRNNNAGRNANFRIIGALIVC